MFTYFAKTRLSQIQLAHLVIPVLLVNCLSCQVRSRAVDGLSRFAPAIAQLQLHFKAAESIEIGACGPEMTVRTKKLDKAACQQLARSLVVVGAYDITGGGITNNNFVELKIHDKNGLLCSCTYLYPDIIQMHYQSRLIMVYTSDEFTKQISHLILDPRQQHDNRM